MDSFFGVGLPELILVLLLSGIVMGPHRIRKVAHSLGRWTAQLQQISRQFARQLNAELDALDDDTVRSTYNDMRELQREVQELRRELSNVPKSLQDQGKSIVDETQLAISDPSSPALKEADAPADELLEPTSPKVSSLPKAIEVPGDPD